METLRYLRNSRVDSHGIKKKIKGTSILAACMMMIWLGSTSRYTITTHELDFTSTFCLHQVCQHCPASIQLILMARPRCNHVESHTIDVGIPENFV